MVIYPRMTDPSQALDGECAAFPSSGRVRFPSASGAFTLVELLVVISIIAIMAAMMLPALSKAKQQVLAAKCLSNQKQLADAFHMYTQDNSDRIVQMADYVSGADIYPAGGFWGGPVTPPTTWTGASNALYAVQTGLQTSNAFYFYCNVVGIYHCPGDMRMQNNPTPASLNGWGYDSYARTQNLGGEPYDDYWGAGATYTKLSTITMPSTTFAMIENADWRGYNVGTWVVDWAGDSFSWESLPTLWHMNVDSISFADGHAELHKWLDPAIITAGQGAAQGLALVNLNGPTNGVDYLYVYKGYQFPGHP
jgi:prepilin-type N-terminal cleavage/methylation domain-containing protein